MLIKYQSCVKKPEFQNQRVNKRAKLKIEVYDILNTKELCIRDIYQ